MEKTKWLTLAGTSLAIVSSTALYINMALFFVLGDYGKPFYANSYLNVPIFSKSLDSVLNVIGMVFACGVLKKVTCEAIQKRFSAFAGYKIKPDSPSPVFDSGSARSE